MDVLGSTDPTAAARADGVTAVVHGDELVVYGGWAADRVWVLYLPTATWKEITTTGAVPPARMYHSAVEYCGHMLVCGGEMMVVPPNGHPHNLTYFELALDTYEWMAVECFGLVPTNRSHHSCVVCGDQMVLLGGKLANGVPITRATVAEAKRVGFYDIHILQIISRTWRRIEMYDPHSPMLWGHTAVNFRDSYILYFGGFDTTITDFESSPLVGQQLPSAQDQPPAAVLSDVVHILNVESMQWMQCTPVKGGHAPVPRAMHVALIHRTEMFIIGGFTVDYAGRAVNVNDCWVWNIEHGTWSRLEFCLPSWTSKKLISGMYHDNLVVCHQLASLFFVDLCRRDSGWQRVMCSASVAPVKSATSPSFHEVVQKLDNSTGVPSATFLQPDADGSGHRGDAGPPPFQVPLPQQDPKNLAALYEAEVKTLKSELDQVKAQLKAQQATAEVRPRVSSPASPQQRGSRPNASPPATRESSEERQSKRLHKWPASSRSPARPKADPKSVTFLDSAPNKSAVAAAITEMQSSDKQRAQSNQDIYEDQDKPRRFAPLDTTTTSDSDLEAHGDARVSSPDYVPPSLSAFMALAEKRKDLQRKRREQVKLLQTKLKALQSEPQTAQKVAMARAVMQEAQRVEEAITQADQRQSLQELGAPPYELSRAPAMKEKKRRPQPKASAASARHEAPLMMSARTKVVPSVARPAATRAEPRRRYDDVSEPSSLSQTQGVSDREAARERVPQDTGSEDERPSTPIQQYWEQLEAVMSQAPQQRTLEERLREVRIRHPNIH